MIKATTGSYLCPPFCQLPNLIIYIYIHIKKKIWVLCLSCWAHYYQISIFFNKSYG